MGVDKAGLRLDGRTLLQRAVDACQSCRHVVVVAPAASVAGINSPGASFSVVLEDPPLGGPVAGIDAGLRALPEGDAVATVLVLAVDLADPDAVVRTLTAGADTGGWVDGVALADDEGWLQGMAALYRRGSLEAALAGLETVRDVSVQRLIRRLDLTPVSAGDAVTADVDTPEQAAALGISGVMEER